MSNAPGTTCFLPVVDNTRQYINVLLILLSEPHGKVPLFIDDWQPFRPSNAMEWAAWAAAKIGLVDPIPYQPIGGLKRARGGFASPDVPAPLGSITTVRTDYEAHFLFQNLMLTGEALRLGGWVHGAPMIPHVWQRDPADGRPRPRLPRVQREDVRLALEALAAGARLAAHLRRHRRRARGPVPAVRHRHGRGGRPGARGEVRPGRHVRRTPRSSRSPTRTRRRPRRYMKHAGHPPAEAIEYTKEICRYLVETYGRFPAHTDAVPPAGHLGAVLAPGDRVLRAVREPSATSQRQAEGREIWDRR